MENQLSLEATIASLKSDNIQLTKELYACYQERKEFLTPERIAEAQKEEFDKEEPMFAMGGIASLMK